MAFKMKGFSGFKSSAMKKDDEPRKGRLSWSELKKGGAVDVWKDAKEKKAAKEAKKKEEEKNKPKRVRCSATNSEGKQCGNKTTNKSGRCYAHD